MKSRASIGRPASMPTETPAFTMPPKGASCADRVDGVGRGQRFAPSTLLQRLATRGITLVIEGDGIAAEGNLDQLTDDDVRAIKAWKAELMGWLHAAAMTDAALEIFGGRIVALVPPGLRCACGGQAWRPSRSARGHVYCIACCRGEVG